MANYLKYVTITAVTFTVYIIVKRSSQSLDEEVCTMVRDLYYTWNKCIVKHLAPIQHDSHKLWDEIGKLSNYCDNYTGMNQLQIMEYVNNDESKYHILPGNNNDKSVIVTIGIGHDISAEDKLKQDLGNNSYFFGADPMVEINEKLYEKIGMFYPFAVAGKSALTKASVLTKEGYREQTVIHVDLIYFLKEIIDPSLTLYDNIWIDAEGGEYSMMPLFYKRGRLDQHNITICQFNIEVHNPNFAQKRQFMNFVNRILIDERYAFLKLITNAGHWRMYFINMENNICSKKYLVRIAP